MNRLTESELPFNDMVKAFHPHIDEPFERQVRRYRSSRESSLDVELLKFVDHSTSESVIDDNGDTGGFCCSTFWHLRSIYLV